MKLPMNSPKVTVVDYGIGNILSVTRALEHVGAEPVVTSDVSAVQSAERLVLPGVGAFAQSMQELHHRGLDVAIKNFALTGRPFLGICLGMQMMLESSEEFGHCEGLSLIPGQVTAIPREGINGQKYKIPHIGWNELYPSHESAWNQTPLANTATGTAAYFVHTFAAHPADPANLLAICHYEGLTIPAAIHSGQHYGCQFHPEKSGPDGLIILRSFLTL